MLKPPHRAQCFSVKINTENCEGMFGSWVFGKNLLSPCCHTLRNIHKQTLGTLSEAVSQTDQQA